VIPFVVKLDRDPGQEEADRISAFVREANDKHRPLIVGPGIAVEWSPCRHHLSTARLRLARARVR
jgi:hypothetical protein